MARMGNFIAGDPALARASSAIGRALFGDPAGEARMYGAAAQYHAGLASADRSTAAAMLDNQKRTALDTITAEIVQRANEGDPVAAAALFASGVRGGVNPAQLADGRNTMAGGNLMIGRPGEPAPGAADIRRGFALTGKAPGAADAFTPQEVTAAQDAVYRRTIDERNLQERGATERNRDTIAGRQRLQDTESINAGPGARVVVSPTHALYGQTRGQVYGPATQSTVMGGVLSRVASGRGSAADQMLALPPIATAPGNAVVGAPGDPRNRAGVLPPVDTAAGAVTSFAPGDPRATGPRYAAPPTPSQAGAGGAGRAPLDVSPADVKGLTDLLISRIPKGYTLPAEYQSEIITRATGHYQQTRDAASAIDMAWGEVLGKTPRQESNWWDPDRLLPEAGYQPPPRRGTQPAGAAGAVTAPAGAPAAAPAAQSGGLPPAARASLREGEVTIFGNGQRWTLVNGQPAQVQ